MKKFFRYALTILALIILTTGNVNAAGKVISFTHGVYPLRPHYNVTFAQYYDWPDVRLKMDILKPNTKEKFPAVVMVPGGWFLVDPTEECTQLAVHIAEKGYVTAVIEYRKAPTFTYQKTIADVRAAIRYLRANADKFGIDANKIAVVGESAGGYLAMMAGATSGTNAFIEGDNLNYSSDVQAVVDIFGPSNLATWGDGFPAEIAALHNSASSPESLFVLGPSAYRNNKGGNIREVVEPARGANPAFYINEKTPPFLIMHGNQDKAVDVNQSEWLHELLTGAGVPNEFYIVDGAGHDGNVSLQPETLKIILDFLNENLKNRR